MQRAYSSSVLRSEVRGTAIPAPALESNPSTSPGDSIPVTEWVAEGLPGGAGQPPATLLYQKSNNCIERKNESSAHHLSPYQKKSRHRLIQVIEWMVRKYGINHVGLLTLTFGVPGSGRGSKETRELREQAKDLEFVQKRWHSFNTNIIAKRYPDWACVLETHKDGVWHLHVVVVTKLDNRTGTDVETLTNYELPAWKRKGKHLRNEALAAEWRTLRETACKYRFGRVELMPIRKTGEALARYLGGYLTKSFKLLTGGRKSRLVRFSRGISKQFTMVYSIWDLSNLIYRTRLKIAAYMLNFREIDDFADYFGPRWHYYLGDIIAGIPIPFKFEKGDFERGLAVKILNGYAENPYPHLDEKGKKQMVAVDAALLQKFTELAFDEAAEMRWRESRPVEADNIDVGPLTSEDFQDDWLKLSEYPF